MKAFVTGISGLLGLNFAMSLRDRFKVAGAFYSHPVVLEGVHAFKVDLTSPDAVMACIHNQRPDVVVHTAGLTNVEECEARPAQAHVLNVEVAGHVAATANALRSKLVHISTDHVFDGQVPWKSEGDIPMPLNTYARTKLEAEGVVLQACPDALIIRTNFFGWGTPVRVSFSDWILRALAQEDELRMFSDVYFTPILINDLIDVVVQLAQRGASGIFHVAGGERLTKHAFALKLAEVFGHPRDTIRAINVKDFPFRARRPGDMSLSSKKTEQYLGFQMPVVKDGLNRLRRLEEAGYRETVRQVVQK